MNKKEEEKKNKESVVNELPKEKYFYLENGTSFKSIKELLDGFDSIDDFTFNKHYLSNDFANWVKHVFNEHELAHKIIWSKGRSDFKNILNDFVYPKKEEIKEDIKEEDKKIVKNANEVNNITLKDERKLELDNKKDVKEEDKNKSEKKDNESVKKDDNKIEEIDQKKLLEKEREFDRGEEEKFLAQQKVKEMLDTEKKKLEIEKDLFNEEKIISKELEISIIIERADKEFNLRYYNEALANYEKALGLKSEDINLKNKIIETKKLLVIKDKEEKEKNNYKEFEELKNKSFATQIEAYTNKYNELKEKIKNARKEGKDVFMANLRIISFKAKMHMAELTREQKHLDYLNEMLLNAEKELEEAINEKQIDVAKEIEEGAKKLFEEEIRLNPIKEIND